MRFVGAPFVAVPCTVHSSWQRFAVLPFAMTRLSRSARLQSSALKVQSGLHVSVPPAPKPPVSDAHVSPPRSLPSHFSAPSRLPFPHTPLVGGVGAAPLVDTAIQSVMASTHSAVRMCAWWPRLSRPGIPSFEGGHLPPIGEVRGRARSGALQHAERIRTDEVVLDP